MKEKLKDIDKKWKVYALAGCVCILFFVVIMNLGGIFTAIGKFFGIIKPVIIGFVLAYIINPIAVFFQRKVFKKIPSEKRQWVYAVILASIIVLIVFALLVASLIPQLIENITQLAENYEVYLNGLVKFLNEKGGMLGGAFVKKITVFVNEEGGLIERIGSLLQDNVTLIIDKTTSIGAAAFNWLIGAIFAIYFLMAKNNFKQSLTKLLSLTLSPLKYEYAIMLGNKFNTIFSKYIVCQIFDSAIIGVASYLFVVIARMPDALFIAVVCGVTNLIPTFGPLIGGAIGAFILLLLKPSAIIAFLIWVAIIQAADAYIIKPKLFGDALNVPGIIILISIIVFGKLMGITGMLLAIPIAAILVYIYSELLIPRLELKKDIENYNK